MKKAMAVTYYEYENRKFHPKALEFVDRNFNNVDFTGIITHYTFDTIRDYADTIVKLAKANGFIIQAKSDGSFIIYDILFKNSNMGSFEKYCL